MAKLESYKGSTELGSGARPMGDNDFPLMDAHHIQTKEDGTRLDKELETLRQNSGGGSGGTSFTVDGKTLTISDEGVLSVNVATEAKAEDERPISAAAVHAIVGNVEAELSTI